MAYPEQQNVMRSAGKELGRLVVTWRPNGVNPPLNAFAAGNTVRRLRRTGVGIWEITFRAGALVQAVTNGTITKRIAYLSNNASLFAVLNTLTVTAGELVVVVTTVDAAGLATEVAAAADRFITVELESESSGNNPPPDLLT